MFGLTRRNRLRDHIRELADLHSMLQHNDLQEAAKSVAAAINFQADQLREAHTAGRRPLKWGPFAVALVCAGLLAIPAYFLWPLSAWWRITIFVIVCAVAFLFIAAGFAVLVEKDSDTA